MSGSPAAATQRYYKALALQKLGRADEAKALFTGLVESGNTALEQPPTPVATVAGRAPSLRARRAVAHYLTGLGCLGLGERARAKSELSQALELSPDLLGARTALASLE